MALSGGSVSINGLTGAASGSGLAKAIYDVLVVQLSASPGQVPQNVPGAQQQLADISEAIGQAVVSYVVANAVVTVAAGIPVSTTGTAAAQTGSTTATGSGTVS